jgi:hypothetical protein
MKSFRLIARILFYILNLFIYLSRAVHWGFSHDENQFIAAGQLLADHGLLPYINYPYTHMPYGAFFYAITAIVSPYDYLAGRILNAAAWLACSLLIVYIFRLFWQTKPALTLLAWEFLIVFIFLEHPSMLLIAGEALNHSLSSAFSLLALWLFIKITLQRDGSHWSAFWCGIFISIAALIRFNYASLIVILIFLFFIYKRLVDPPQIMRSFLSFIAGLGIAAFPALVLILRAPNSFFYGNFVYTRLNTIYYQELLFKTNMELGSKVTGFLSHLTTSPIDLILYLLLLFVGITSLIQIFKNRSIYEINKLAITGFAFTLFLTAFTPTPTQQQYYFAPLPFLLIVLAVIGYDLHQRNKVFFYIAILGSLVALNPGLKFTNPLSELAYLPHPSQWTPLQVHDFADEIKIYVPKGRILTLIPMIPLEAGDESYPFTTTGPFSWRTSFLLSSERRAHYGVISPAELPTLLDDAPPSAILTGFESPYDGFKRSDPGGLETPLIDYAKENGYKPIILSASFIGRPITIWVKSP